MLGICNRQLSRRAEQEETKDCEVKAVTGSKREAKRSWLRGRGPTSMRAEIKFSLKMNKKYLNRKVRRTSDAMNGNAYKKLAKDRAWQYVT